MKKYGSILRHIWFYISTRWKTNHLLFVTALECSFLHLRPNRKTFVSEYFFRLSSSLPAETRRFINIFICKRFSPNRGIGYIEIPVGVLKCKIKLNSSTRHTPVMDYLSLLDLKSTDSRISYSLLCHFMDFKYKLSNRCSLNIFTCI